ncbi:hypothetical protein LTR49_028490 [Elasticomyces elasticus]|nr:hypothetical protein LTR49_028490 [Elasticomyces elasticus]
MGHEGLGTVSDVRDAVDTLKVEDYVVIPDSVASGHLETGSTMSSAEGFGFGGDLGGLQAEYARVPNACCRFLISSPLDDKSLDFAGFQPGDSVAIFGAGSVGLLAALAAKIRGASRVFSIDRIEKRLGRAASIGAIPIDFSHNDPAAEIKAYEPCAVCPGR